MSTAIRPTTHGDPEVDDTEFDDTEFGAAVIDAAEAGRIRCHIVVRGLVQGVGFRPFVYVTATELHLTGSVINDSDGVVIDIEGDSEQIAAFTHRLHTNAPPLAIVDSVDVTRQPVRGGTGFQIGDSAASGGGRTLASPDVATCPDCLLDLVNPVNRRYRHPFVSCTNCGPRFTIISALPYDRAATTMTDFDMCDACTAEYRDPTDQRFHAQPIACPDCGPRLEFIGPDGAAIRGDDLAMAGARRALAAGRIVAVKGLGGYHLVCDAGDERAVRRLRDRKQRGDKPFAVMVADLATARRLAAVCEAEAELLTSPARPIVLLARPTGDPRGVARSVAPGSPDLGVLLPYTPVHSLLFGLVGDAASPPVLVMTSGNMSGEPIITDDDLAAELLAPLVDCWLRHDRPIQVPCDDSVSRVVDGAPLPIRRSRGYAPLPVALPVAVGSMLAVGADLKNACGIADGKYAWMSQHIGDMDDLRSLNTLGRTAAHLQMLTGVQPDRLIADRHPGYRSADWARRHQGDRALSTVQHHHAHICSVMAENGIDTATTVIGIAFDGTGFGTDGAVWGGEVLLARYRDFRRFAHLGYVPLPGGDVTVERPYRMALSHLYAAGVEWSPELACVAQCSPTERAILTRQLATEFGCVPTSSMGRMFDAVSALAGVRQVCDYEAQAAIELEGLCRARESLPAELGDSAPYRFPLDDRQASAAGTTVVADPGPVIRAVAADALAGEPADVIGLRFHRAVIELIADLADRARNEVGLQTVALSGGVFQNALLLRGACAVLRRRGFTVLRHRRVPPNDGGLALGQLMAAACLEV